MTSFADRYLAGQTVQVWTEIIGLGQELRDDPAVLADADIVGRETMRRSRRNVERLITELPEIGYRFEPGKGLDVFAPPSPTVVADLDEIEERVGQVPLAFRWWLEEVGAVNLCGHHPDWAIEFSDPLVVLSPPDFISSEIDEWEANLGTKWERKTFAIDFSPDLLHKADVSGGAPYALAVPNGAADGLVLWERHQTTFVNLLRIAFHYGGFLGFSAIDQPGRQLPEDLLRLGRSLESI